MPDQEESEAHSTDELFTSIGNRAVEFSSLGFGSSLFSARAAESASFTSREGLRNSFAEAQGATVPGSRASVSVLVTARNYAVFLKECLESILQQTSPVDEIIYSDDGSDDESLDVVQQIPRVKVLCRRHEGIAASRNAAVAASTGDFLVHVDGDDVLTPDFIERHLQALQSNPEATFAYGPAEGFGIRTCNWDAPPWNRNLLWARNYVNTSAMYRRWAFEAAGGWRTGVGTCFDWDLALRASRFGPAVASSALLRYRQHPQSWSRAFWKDRLTTREVTKLHGRIRQSAVTVTIGCVYSGRLPGLLPRWLDALAMSIRNTDLPRPNLFFVDGTPEQSAGELLLKEASRYAEFRQVQYTRGRSVRRPPFERSQRDARATFMATACNQVLDGSNTDVAWFVEDDILVPENAYATLLSSLMRGRAPRAAVAGIYRSRHEPENLVAHTYGNRICTLKEMPKQPTEVDLTGSGCLMILRPFARHRFTSHVQQIPAHDWAWCLDLKKQGGRVLLEPEVACRHYVDLEHYV